jgi:hypothetical protein
MPSKEEEKLQKSLEERLNAVLARMEEQGKSNRKYFKLLSKAYQFSGWRFLPFGAITNNISEIFAGSMVIFVT